MILNHGSEGHGERASDFAMPLVTGDLSTRERTARVRIDKGPGPRLGPAELMGSGSRILFTGDPSTRVARCPQDRRVVSYAFGLW